jgi:hypothetical protein
MDDILAFFTKAEIKLFILHQFVAAIIKMDL